MKKKSSKKESKKEEMEKPQVSVGPHAIPQEMKEKEGPHDHEIEDAANTLLRAEKIKKNTTLMPHVHKHMKGKMDDMKAISSIEEMKEKRNEVFKKAGKGED